MTDEKRPESPEVDPEHTEVSLQERIVRNLARAQKALGGHTSPSWEERYQPAREVQASREIVEVAKAGTALIEQDKTEHSNVLPSNDDVHTLFTMAGALYPPYDPEVLVTLMEHSNSLRPNIDAYCTNIEAFGYKLEPVIDMDAGDADEKIGDAMFMERLQTAETMGANRVGQAEYPLPAEIANRKKEIQALMRLEHAQVSTFFEFCCNDMSFTELRKRNRYDLENIGNAYWEVLRNQDNEVTQFVYVPAYSVRLIPIEHRHHEYPTRRKVSLLAYKQVIVRKRFRRFVQVVLDRIVHFKEFGDPRVISRKTGREYPSVEEMQKQDAHDGPATELIHFKVHSPRSPYGIPRWIGALLSVMGSRSSEEVNFLYFDNKAVPPLAVLVSGGKLAEASVNKLQSYVRDNIKGKENYHRILVLEAEAGANAGMVENGRVRIALQPLREAQETDALFQGYDERNIDKVGMAFRVPRLLRGDVRDFNRATAEAAVEFAEMQVFQPEREAFDDFINRHILPALGIRFWKFESKSPINRKPADVATMAQLFASTGALTPNEIRDLAGEAFNKDYPKITDAWGDQPFQLTLQGIMSPEDGALPAAGTPDNPTPVGPTAPPGKSAAGDDMRLRAVAAALVNLRSQLARRADDQRKALFKRAAEAVEDPSTVVIRLPKAEIDALFQ